MIAHRLAAAALVLIVMAAGSVVSEGSDSVSHSAVDRSAAKSEPVPGTHIELTDDGAWSWLPGPRAVCHTGEHRRLYVGWIDGKGEVWIGSYDQVACTLETATLTEELRGDDHSNPSLLMLPDGRLMVFYSAHGGSAVWSRTTVAPEDIAEWTEARPITGVTNMKWGHTYPNAVRLAGEDGRIYVFFRGPDFKPWFVTSEDGTNWTGERPLMRGPGKKPYFKYASDGNDTIHIAFTDGHPRGESLNSVYYMQYRDGAFYRIDGSLIKVVGDLPVRPPEVDKVYDAAGTGARAWVWDIAVDGSGHPVIAYVVFVSEEDHRYRYARWDGTRWQDTEVVEGGGWFVETPFREYPRASKPLFYLSGGVAIDHDDPSVLYLSRPVDGVHEIEKWVTPDAGRTWSGQSVTLDSSADNVRPAVPVHRVPGAPEVLWLCGEYVDYDDYNMGIKMVVPGGSCP